MIIAMGIIWVDKHLEREFCGESDATVYRWDDHAPGWGMHQECWDAEHPDEAELAAASAS